MKNSSRFSYTLSAAAFVAVISLLLGYFLGTRKAVRQMEGFANTPCNICNQAKPNCGCKGSHQPPVNIIVIDDEVGPSKMNKALGSQSGSPSALGSQSGSPSAFGPQSGSPSAFGPQSVSPPTGLPDNCPPRAPCPVPDATKYVLKSTVPPCPAMPDMTRYMLKTECPSQPDMSKYVLKSSVPKCPPCISSCSKPCKIGDCPPCPRPRCPVASCPEPKPCPACPDVQVASCPEPRVQCKAQYEPESKVRPMLASTAAFGL